MDEVEFSSKEWRALNAAVREYLDVMEEDLQEEGLLDGLTPVQWGQVLVKLGQARNRAAKTERAAQVDEAVRRGEVTLTGRTAKEGRAQAHSVWTALSDRPWVETRTPPPLTPQELRRVQVDAKLMRLDREGKELRRVVNVLQATRGDVEAGKADFRELISMARKGLEELGRRTSMLESLVRQNHEVLKRQGRGVNALEGRMMLGALQTEMHRKVDGLHGRLKALEEGLKAHVGPGTVHYVDG